MLEAWQIGTGNRGLDVIDQFSCGKLQISGGSTLERLDESFAGHQASIGLLLSLVLDSLVIPSATVFATNAPQLGKHCIVGRGCETVDLDCSSHGPTCLSAPTGTWDEYWGPGPAADLTTRMWRETLRFLRLA